MNEVTMAMLSPSIVESWYVPPLPRRRSTHPIASSEMDTGATYACGSDTSRNIKMAQITTLNDPAPKYPWYMTFRMLASAEYASPARVNVAATNRGAEFKSAMAMDPTRGTAISARPWRRSGTE